MTDTHRDIFKEEANEILIELESALLELENNKKDPDLISKIFRGLHTIKGSGAMFGFIQISQFTHEVETIYDQVRDGIIVVSKELINLTLKACDHIKLMLNDEEVPERQKSVTSKELIDHFNDLMQQTQMKEQNHRDNHCNNENRALIQTASKITYRIHFHPHLEIFSTGTNPLLLLDEMREMGACHILAFVDQIPPLDSFNPELCYIYWELFLTTSKGINEIKDVFIFVEGSCDLKIDIIDQGIESDEDYKKLGEILVERGDISTDKLQEALNQQKKIGDVLVESGLTNEKNVNVALLEQNHIREMRKKRQDEEYRQYIRVSSEKLDRLVNLVGEMVTMQALLGQMALEKEDSKLYSIAEEVERLTEELRENTMSMRMVPIGSTFNKFKRLVRDLSNQLQKEINLETNGAETELDKTVIEKLSDPLVQLIRNSIDHGIEKPDIREKHGKSKQGKVLLSAEHSGAHVLIKIQDDGSGMDPDIIRKKAIEKGLISPDEKFTNKEIFSLIFTPGFSTANKISTISGRGVGMDVVKKTIASLRGSIEIDSQKNIGTTIALKIPLTLAIIEGLLVTVDSTSFIIPLSQVEECIELTPQNIKKANGRHLINVRGTFIPYLRLRKQLCADKSQNQIEHIVITDINGFKVGFVVDEILGEHQTVIKTLGRVYRDIDGISGATILGDGSIALILDTPKLLKVAEEAERKLDILAGECV